MKGICVGAEGGGGGGGPPTVRSRVQAEMVEFIALPFPSSKKPKIWSFYVVVVQERQSYLQKGVLHVQSCCFAN